MSAWVFGQSNFEAWADCSNHVFQGKNGPEEISHEAYRYFMQQSRRDVDSYFKTEMRNSRRDRHMAWRREQIKIRWKRRGYIAAAVVFGTPLAIFAIANLWGLAVESVLN